MKKILFLATFCLYMLRLVAQQELHIHHINIENGDATMIGIWDAAKKKYTSKVLIDGGLKPSNALLLPYLKEMIGPDAVSLHFNYVALTHYHNDHYTGLLCLKTGDITADSVIDPGGYDMKEVFGQTISNGTVPEKLELASAWTTALTTAAHHSPAFVKGHSKVMVRYGTDGKTNLGNTITLGKVGTNKVQLQVIAGWGNTLAPHNEIEPNPAPTRSNANNFTLGFIVTCGEFRYFIGGDMGGSGGSYIDQETTVTSLLNSAFPSAKSMDGSKSVSGHVCGFKANHHGSDNSNKTDFMNGMTPAITVTSAGDKASWHLPSVDYLDRLNIVQPLSAGTEGNPSRGVYFTNLYDFSSDQASLTTAEELFKGKEDISFDYGNDADDVKAGYLIKVTDAATLKKQSSFEVGRVDIHGSTHYSVLATFFCHRK